MDDKLKRNRLTDDSLKDVSGGTEITKETENVRYGGEECPECGSLDTETHYQNGHMTYIKCFECGFEKHYN
ncbi:MAG: hypothetical protein K6A90_15945 [Lachnospiraceae bacterium]|nr:hypothetical protein [Lachnospiraceae bacterium]